MVTKYNSINLKDHVSWETVCCAKNSSSCMNEDVLTFLLRIMKWPKSKSLHYQQFDFLVQRVLNTTTLAMKITKRESQLLTIGTHLHNRSWDDSCPFGVFPLPQTNTCVHSNCFQAHLSVAENIKIGTFTNKSDVAQRKKKKTSERQWIREKP